ncbi:hypothetical protein [Anaerobaca lacustris]|uniref:DUF1559 domain-containing protein n=1 Tax=Anaerobaca lacustris TaxID=3044600 RepID=A0AAW6TUS8_9BACT|nr:hypothetical protein [Sedimentisphaerales bacterium M17dextr]
MKCASCGQPCPVSQGPPTTVQIKLSGAAVASAVLAVLAWLCFVPAVIAAMDRYILNPESSFVILTALVTLFSMPSGFILGIVGLVEISRSGGRRTGYGFAAIGASAPAVFVLTLMYLPFVAGRELAPRTTCGTNLAMIGKAMLIYANDYDDKLPLAGGRGTVWGPGLADWRSERQANAFGLDPNGFGGQATISSSLYLLVRYGDVSPKSFVCRGERGVREFDPTKYRVDGKRLTDVWDFGPNPAKHCSYAYHQPYGPYALTTSSEPGIAVAADHNPWIDSARWKADDFAAFRPVVGSAATGDEMGLGNAKAHGRDGQNVLFLDSHVEFAKRAFCGLENDNIYTAWDGDDKARGRAPTPYDSQPTDPRDSLLLSDPPLKR